MFAQHIITPFAPCQDPVRQNRCGLSHIAAFVATATLSTPWLDFVLAWISSFRLQPLPFSSRHVFAPLPLFLQWACMRPTC
jgi:hypothetical protein